MRTGRSASRAVSRGAAALAASRGRAGRPANLGAATAPAFAARACPAGGRRSPSKYGDWSPNHHCAPLRGRDEAECLVQPPHRLVALLALGQQALEACALGRGDLGALQCRRNASAAPVTPGDGEAMEGAPALRQQEGVADHLVFGEREEAELRETIGPVDVHCPPALIALRAGRAGDVLVGLHRKGIHLVEAVRLVRAGDDADALRRLGLRRFDPVELEHDRLLAADRDEATALEEGPGFGVTLLDLALDLLLAELTRARRDLREQGRADTASASGRDHCNIALGVRAPGLDEAAGDAGGFRRRGLGAARDPGRGKPSRYLVRSGRRRRGARCVRERQSAKALRRGSTVEREAAAAGERSGTNAHPDEARRDDRPRRRGRKRGGPGCERQRGEARAERRHGHRRSEGEAGGVVRRDRRVHGQVRRCREVRHADHEQRRGVELYAWCRERDVTVVVRVFAGLRERAGWSTREVEAATVADVWPELGLGDEPEGLLYAVNREYADPGRELQDGDEVALIPPVSGGAFRVTEEPLSLDAVVAEVADERAGGIATFTRTVRP